MVSNEMKVKAIYPEVLHMRITLILAFLVVAILAATGCSTTGDVASPPVSQPKAAESEHQIWGIMDFSWDGVSGGLTAVQNRALEAHFNVTASIVPNNITITVLSWNPTTRVLTVRATMHNPTNLTGHDVRLILTNLGDKKLLNADDYTKLFDSNVPPVRTHSGHMPRQIPRGSSRRRPMRKRHLRSTSRRISPPHSLLRHPGQATAPSRMISSPSTRAGHFMKMAVPCS